MEDGVQRSLLGALKDGTLEALCDFENVDGKRISEDKPIFAKDWRGTTDTGFSEAVDRRRVLNLRPGSQPRDTVWAVNVSIETKQLDDWLSPPPRASSAAAKAGCLKWMRQLAESGELSKQAKSHWLDEAKKRFGEELSERAYDDCRAKVAEEFPEISRPGRKSKG